ncbi:MAG TPA: hypothetical protein VMH91_00880 [Candidatus Paceibacterota bacterium]|nr:hypothetical protein [Candidatus Paceibacterota bacterium]
MTVLPQIKDIKNRTIILDSNIPIWYATEGFKERSGNPLRVLVDNGNKLAITPISGLEILVDDNKEEVKKKYLIFMSYVQNISLEPAYFQNAAILASEYRRICNQKKIPLPDLIIGGVVVAHSFGKNKPLLFTADRTDFCEPLWITTAYLGVPDKENKQIQPQLYLLELNTEILDPKLKQG